VKGNERDLQRYRKIETDKEGRIVEEITYLLTYSMQQDPS
jgi:hypothetical protein